MGRNVIIFTTDQQQELRWFPSGWEAENLPGLTRLRNKGVAFSRAYTNTDDDITRYKIGGWNSPDAGGDAKLKNYGGGTTDHDGRFFGLQVCLLFRRVTE